MVGVGLGVCPSGVGSAVGGVNWVGVGSRVSVGGGVVTATTVAVTEVVGVMVSAARVAVGRKRCRVGVGVTTCL